MWHLGDRHDISLTTESNKAKRHSALHQDVFSRHHSSLENKEYDWTVLVIKGIMIGQCSLLKIYDWAMLIIEQII